MKVQIVYLNPEDDIHSTRDMLSWVKAPRALLVWPDRGRILSRRLDLILLQRYATQRQIEIGLLTFDKEIRDEAFKLGIPLFNSLEDLPEADWVVKQHSVEDLMRNENGDTKPHIHQDHPERRIEWFERLEKSHKVLLVSSVVFSLTLLSSIFLPSVRIVLSPSLTKQSFNFDIDLSNDSYGEIDGDRIPIQTISLWSEGKVSRKSSGTTRVPISPATGMVTFSSFSQETIEIPTNTTLRTSGVDGIRFRTTEPASLEGELGAVVEVPIEAVSPGWKGNVPAGSISLVDGSLGLLVKVINVEPTSGGKDEVQGMVLQEDLDQLQEELIQILMDRTEEECGISTQSDQILVEGSLEVKDILESHFDHAPGDVADSLSLDLELELSGLTISSKSLQDLSMELFSDTLSLKYLPVPGSFTFSCLMQESVDEPSQRWVHVSVDVDTYHMLNAGKLKRVIRGKKHSDAVDLLLELYPLSSHPDFLIKPSWYPILPVIDQRIDFNWIWEKNTR